MYRIAAYIIHSWAYRERSAPHDMSDVMTCVTSWHHTWSRPWAVPANCTGAASVEPCLRTPAACELWSHGYSEAGHTTLGPLKLRMHTSQAAICKLHRWGFSRAAPSQFTGGQGRAPQKPGKEGFVEGEQTGTLVPLAVFATANSTFWDQVVFCSLGLWTAYEWSLQLFLQAH